MEPTLQVSSYVLSTPSSNGNFWNVTSESCAAAASLSGTGRRASPLPVPSICPSLLLSQLQLWLVVDRWFYS